MNTTTKTAPAVSGYRPLTPEQVQLMNEVKAAMNQVGEIVAKLRATEGLDQRAISIGATEAQTASMWLCRGIAQPSTFA